MQPDPDPVVFLFDVTESQKKKIDQWYLDIMNMYLHEQGEVKEDGIPFTLEEIWDRVNYGAIGGEFTYVFIPTSIGTVLRVKESRTGLELDVTDYSSW